MTERFRQLVHYVREAAGLTSAQFVKVHNHPFLIWPQGQDWTEETFFQFETLSGEYDSQQPSEASPPGSESQVSNTLVVEVRKQVSSSPTNMICVGRAANNDIVFANNTVSKLHAYFLKTAVQSSLEVVDANSTNGTRVNRRRLVPYQSQPLLNRDHIQFGPFVQVMYLTASGFLELLQQLHRTGIV